jgi:hypothetical protein
MVKRLGVSLAMAVVAASLALALPAGASASSAFFIDDDHDCDNPNRQVSSLSAAFDLSFLWLNTATGLDPTESYELVLVPLTPGGTEVGISLPLTFQACPSNTWAYSTGTLVNSSFVPGTYMWLLFDASGQLVGSDTVRYV